MSTANGLTIVNCAVFDGESEELLDGPVHVTDGVITAVGGAAPAAGQVIDARGGTVIPGLIDAHFHAYAIGFDMLALDWAPRSYVTLAGARRLTAALARGFTTVRDPSGGDHGLARAIGEGLLPSPRYLYTGPGLSQTGGHVDPRGDSDTCAGHGHIGEVVDGVDALRRAVRERFRQGAHAIKIMTSGGVVSQIDPLRVPQYSAEEVRAVCEEAGRRGSYVAAHAYSPEAILHSVENGVRSIEHGNLLDAGTAAVMAARGAYLVPTLAAYDAMDRRGAAYGMSPVSKAKNLEVLNAGRRAIEHARVAGVPIGLGSDLVGELEDEQLAALRLHVEVEGVYHALTSATSVNADLLMRPDLGRVKAGSPADLLILPGDPFQQPSLLWEQSEGRTVIQAGRRLGSHA
ncbi:metal-dependent hydrolase family protein [Nonomuraea bangladeshensis]|uniref:metal-dependent hydrolase family protein n=1 Tax=Nonomuraea bangladeshensis TaxID=404385 RepID=UPI0031DCFD45